MQEPVENKLILRTQAASLLRQVFLLPEEPTFCTSLGPVWRSSSSDGLTRAQGLSSEASIESNEVKFPPLLPPLVL